MTELADPILKVDRLTKRYDRLARLVTWEERRVVHAVEDVSFAIAHGTTFALVGESGCGKSTIARCVSGILPVTAGSLAFMGADIARFRNRRADDFSGSLTRASIRAGASRISEPIVTHDLIEGRAKIDAAGPSVRRLSGAERCMSRVTPRCPARPVQRAPGADMVRGGGTTASDGTAPYLAAELYPCAARGRSP